MFVSSRRIRTISVWPRKVNFQIWPQVKIKTEEVIKAGYVVQHLMHLDERNILAHTPYIYINIVKRSRKNEHWPHDVILQITFDPTIAWASQDFLSKNVVNVYKFRHDFWTVHSIDTKHSRVFTIWLACLLPSKNWRASKLGAFFMDQPVCVRTHSTSLQNPQFPYGSTHVNINGRCGAFICSSISLKC